MSNKLTVIIKDITNEGHPPYHQYLAYVVTPASCDEYLFSIDGDLNVNEELKIKEKLSKIYQKNITLIKSQYKCCYQLE